MAAMNLTGTNMAKRANMVGLPQRARTKRTETRQQTVTTQPTPQQKQQKQVQKDTFTKQSAQDKPKAHRRKVQSVMTRYVASTGKKTDAQKAQSKDTKEAQKQAFAREKQDLPQPKAKTPLDNASRIGLMYKSKMRQQAHKAGRRMVGEQQQQPQGQQARLKRFLGNLRQYVNLEYKQYGSQDNSLYSRRNLREILTALGHETKAFDNKVKKDRMSRTTGTVEHKPYNKHYEIRAQRNLKMYQDDLLREQTDPFEMIA